MNSSFPLPASSRALVQRFGAIYALVYRHFMRGYAIHFVVSDEWLATKAKKRWLDGSISMNNEIRSFTI